MAWAVCPPPAVRASVWSKGLEIRRGDAAHLRLSRRPEIGSFIVGQELTHRLYNLIWRGGDSPGITVDLDLQAPHTVNHKGGHIFETHLKFVRQIERFVVRDNAERNVRFLGKRFARLIVRAEVNFRDRLQCFYHVQGRAEAIVSKSNEDRV